MDSSKLPEMQAMVLDPAVPKLLIGPGAQKALLFFWLMGIAGTVVAGWLPIRWTGPVRTFSLSFTGLLTCFIAWFWWHTIAASSQDNFFALRQLGWTLVRISAQAVLIAVVIGAALSVARKAGESLLPHFLGIDFSSLWLLPSSRVLLPCALFYGFFAATSAFGFAFWQSFRAHGLLSALALSSGTCAIAMAMSLFFFFRLCSVKKQELIDLGKEIQVSAPGSEAMSKYRKAMEYRLGTREGNSTVFHRIADEPYGLSYRFPGFLIGIEKANRFQIGVPDEAEDGWNAEAREKGIPGLLNDRKRTFISHIVEFRPDRDSAELSDLKPEFICNLYQQTGPLRAYAQGFERLREMGGIIQQRLDEGGYTHILLFCMGWNTDQQESIRNYNSLMGYLTEAAGKSSFRPLVIGISWPSEWAALKPFSYPAKAGDADETGLVWGSYLLKKVLLPVKRKAGLPLILVGHSFGARVLTRAVASDPAWIQKDFGMTGEERAAWDAGGVDLFVGLQGAFSANRFVDKGPLISGGVEGTPYAGLAKLPGRFIFTWSEFDAANPVAGYVTGASHIGGSFGGNLAFQHRDVFWPCMYGEGGKTRSGGYYGKREHYHPDSGWGPDASALSAGRIISLNVTPIVYDHPYGKGGKAHSDIYKPEIGRLLWKSILAFASPVPAAAR